MGPWALGVGRDREAGHALRRPVLVAGDEALAVPDVVSVVEEHAAAAEDPAAAEARAVGGAHHLGDALRAELDGKGVLFALAHFHDPAALGQIRHGIEQRGVLGGLAHADPAQAMAGHLREIEAVLLGQERQLRALEHVFEVQLHIQLGRLEQIRAHAAGGADVAGLIAVEPGVPARYGDLAEASHILAARLAVGVVGRGDRREADKDQNDGEKQGQKFLHNDSPSCCAAAAAAVKRSHTQRVYHFFPVTARRVFAFPLTVRAYHTRRHTNVTPIKNAQSRFLSCIFHAAAV